MRFIPAVFSHTGQTHDEFKVFVREQVRHKLIDFEGEAKNSRIRSVMRWWSRCISMAIAKTASRNVAFYSARGKYINFGQSRVKWTLHTHETIMK